MDKKKKIIVIGAGIAGISAAMRLADEGCKVLLLENRNIIGGRCYSLTDRLSGETIDNGQHLMVGAYTHFLNMLDTLGTRNLLKEQKNLKITFIEKNGKKSCLDTSLLPARFGMMLGLMRLKGVSFVSKMALINMFMKIKSKKLKSEGKTALELIEQNKQAVDIIERFWEPLILATTNASPAAVSADLLLAVLERAFFAGKKASRLLLPKVGLSSFFEPFQEWFEAKGGRLLLKTRPKELLFKKDRIAGIRFEGKVKIFSDAVISAVPPKSIFKMLPEELSTNEYFKRIADYQYSTIISIYLWLDRNIMDEDFAALLGMNVHWIFDKRKISGGESGNESRFPALYALTISAADELAKLSSEELIEICFNELKEALPLARDAKLLHYRVIKSRQATILATPEINKIRLDNKTPIENFFIAGDWTNTRLPATIESAALSGELAAGLALE